MATPKLPITFSLSPLPSGQTYTYQELADAIVARLSILAEEEYSIITVTDTLPTSNVGPVLLGGLAWYVWDSGSGAYVPIPINPSLTVPKYPFRGDLTADQDQVFGGAGTLSTDLVFSETIDPNNVFAASQFTAPIAGIYNIRASARIAYAGGAPAPSAMYLQLKKNTIALGNDLAIAPDWQGTYNVNSTLQLAAGDSISVNFTSIAIAAGTVRIVKQGTTFSGERVQ